jgi:hypothetical protein
MFTVQVYIKNPEGWVAIRPARSSKPYLFRTEAEAVEVMTIIRGGPEHHHRYRVVEHDKEGAPL